MALDALLHSLRLDHLLLTLFLFPILLVSLQVLYRISPFHPLSKIPGPYLARLSSLWLTYHAWIGDECTTVHHLHQKYGPVVRTGPMSVDITDGEALAPIYTDKGGFRKPMFYANFDIDGHKSIFSEIVPEHRSVRAKAVLPMFSTGNLRQGRAVFYECVDLWIERMKESRGESKGKPVNILDLTRGLAIDVVSAYLFGKRFGGLDASTSQKIINGMEASGMVDSFVAVGRYWYLPGWAFQWVEWIESKLRPNHEAANSMTSVDEFVAGVVEAAESQKQKGESTYQTRLLDAGISVSETRAQCKDLIFAGTDSTGMNLATICFLLTKHPQTYSQLKKELRAANPSEDEIPIPSLPPRRHIRRPPSLHGQPLTPPPRRPSKWLDIQNPRLPPRHRSVMYAFRTTLQRRRLRGCEGFQAREVD